MAEGGTLPWKYQTTVEVPTLSYKNLKKPLAAPRGTRWHYDKSTKEWSLVPDGPLEVDNSFDEHPIAVEGQVVGDGNSDDILSVTGSNFVEHIVQPADTFQGICLRYKLTPTQLRQANNGFSGSNLQLAPNPLMIPTKTNQHDEFEGHVTRGTTTNTSSDENAYPTALTEDQVIALFQRQFETLSKNEAKAYLELSGWELDKAVLSASQDGF